MESLTGREGGEGFRYVLARTDVRLVWFAQLDSQSADKFVMFSLIILAYRLSGASTEVAITLLAYTVPAVVSAPCEGVFADRHDRKRSMVDTNLLRARLVALNAVASRVPGLEHEVWHLLVITFVFSMVGQLFSPAEAAAIPTVVGKEAILTANSMVMMTMVLTLVVGGALAPIVSRLNIYAPYWWASLLFALAGGLIALARIPKQQTPGAPEDRHPVKQLMLEMKEGWDFLRGSPVLLLSFFELSLAVLVMFMMFTLAPAYVHEVIGIEPQDSYVILLPATAGAMLGSLLLGQFGRRLNRMWLLVGGLAGTGLTLMLMASLPAATRQFADLRETTRAVSSVFSFVLGLEFGALMIPSLSYLMEHTADAVRGRIFALLFMVINGVTAVPVLLAAALSDLIGTNHVIGALGLLLAGTGVLVAGFAGRAFAADTGPGRRPLSAPGRPGPSA